MFFVVLSLTRTIAEKKIFHNLTVIKTDTFFFFLYISFGIEIQLAFVGKGCVGELLQLV